MLTSSSLPDQPIGVDSSVPGILVDIDDISFLSDSDNTSTTTRVVLDTSVLVADPTSLLNFPGCDVVIPLTVVEELDGLKTRVDDVGRSARTALRTIEELRRQAGGSLVSPMAVHDVTIGGTVRIEVNGIQRHLLIEHGLDPEVPDNRIIGAALGQSQYAPTRIISNDAALRIKAAHLGLIAEEHRPIGSNLDTRPMGWHTFDTTVENVDDLYRSGGVEVSSVEGATVLYENNFAVLRSGSQSALTRCRENELRLLAPSAPEAWGLRARSKEQRFALELLLDPDITVLAFDGRAGTGKTVMAIAAGFVLRVYAGVWVIDAHLNVWFLLAVTSFALFLAIGKRRSELTLLHAQAAKHRETLLHYP
ncbi:MAG: PIN domain-containing protein, partial [Ilumatobacteraceae bacterium]